MYIVCIIRLVAPSDADDVGEWSVCVFFIFHFFCFYWSYVLLVSLRFDVMPTCVQCACLHAHLFIYFFNLLGNFYAILLEIILCILIIF